MRVRGRCLSAAGWFVLSACVWEGRAFFSAVSLFGVVASRLARLNCRRFLVGQFFLSGDVCVVGRSCLGCHALPWCLGSKIVCSIDEKVAWLRRTLVRYRTCFGFVSSCFHLTMSDVRCFTSLLPVSMLRDTIRV